MAYIYEEDYDFSLFESTYSTAAPDLRPKKQTGEPAIKPVRRTSPDVKVKTEPAVVYRTAPVIIAISVAVILFSALLCSTLYLKAQAYDLSRDIAAVEEDIAVAESENVRLAMALDAVATPEEIAEYAVNVLGMVKLESYRITYFDFSDEDVVLYSGSKTYD